MFFKSMLLSYTVWSVLTGFIAGMLVSLYLFNNTVDEYVMEDNKKQEEKIETVYYTVEMLTEEMEAEWIPEEK